MTSFPWTATRFLHCRGPNYFVVQNHEMWNHKILMYHCHLTAINISTARPVFMIMHQLLKLFMSQCHLANRHCRSVQNGCGALYPKERRSGCTLLLHSVVLGSNHKCVTSQPHVIRCYHLLMCRYILLLLTKYTCDTFSFVY
jgi:hypothetical protein